MRLGAEKKCRKVRMGTIQWTPELAEIRNLIRYWSLARKKCLGFKIDRKFFKRVAHSVSLPSKLDVERSIVDDSLGKARQKLKQYKATHIDRRETWLEGLAKALAAKSQGEDTPAIDLHRLKHLKLLRQHEAQRRTARVIRRVIYGSTLYQPLDQVQFTTQNNTIETTNDKNMMKKKLIEENQIRFNQAAESPFLQDPLVKFVGKMGEAQGVRRILDGNLDTESMEGVERYTRLIIKQMEKPPNFSPARLDEDINTFVNGWRKAREQTASGRSQLHFGHFIAACCHFKLKHIEYEQAQFPLKTGYSPVRWQQGIEVMLLKQPNNFHVNRLRAILLFEADFNHNNKRIGRCLMSHAEQHGWIAPEQYGSRKQLSAIDHCLNKCISFDIIRQYKKPAVICVNDMKGCYDRIVHSVASICMQRLGVTNEALRSMFLTLQHLQHYIRTAHVQYVL
jgi:hypothetical protein